MHQALYERANPSFSHVRLDQFQSWSLDPRNFFYVLLYKRSFLGLFFALSLKPETFNDLINYNRQKISITEADIANPEEEKSIYLLSSFSLDNGVLSLLFSRLYAYLIINQETLREIGLITTQKDIEKLVERMNFRHRNKLDDEGKALHSYTATLDEMVRAEEFIRALFPKKHCKEI
jgi:hypothetical protein